MRTVVNDFINALQHAVDYKCRFTTYIEDENGMKNISVDMIVDDNHADKLTEDWGKLTDIADLWGYNYDDTRGRMMFSVPVGREVEPDVVVPLDDLTDEYWRAYQEIVACKHEKPQNGPITCRPANDSNTIVGAAIIAGFATLTTAVVMEFRKQRHKPENKDVSFGTQCANAIRATVRKPKVWLCTAGMMMVGGGIAFLARHRG